MQVHARVFWLPKTGNTAEEYEDAFYPNRDGDYGGTQLRFAVADGASEGMLSGQWAQILVRAYCRAINTSQMPDLLARALPSWRDWKQHYLDLRERQGRPVMWFEEPGLEKGAFSTLLGLTLRDGDDPGWNATALGDSCMFQVRAGALVTAMPIDDAEAFGSRPFLIASNPARNNGLLERVHYATGDWQPGDRFYLMTDALAHWFVRECEAGATPWTAILAAEDPDAFDAWTATLKREHQIRNDDITLLCLEVAEDVP
ncbi:MAG TPA: protein phosphatase 2C domain-containing protein [Aggregatilinea sp.]|uniref:protein phosphatase 2C domain-containing protein n=1 Tax=Aggregatilinea sp. TaxID=2806333 RepID=UPI002CA110FB|nr:protein phosphatase 2C domain-containing protein [Aggregatilinea sp.]HML20768.1 protein phosphatase 2C domain-containing protein [Aggregatilinea sp.]